MSEVWELLRATCGKLDALRQDHEELSQKYKDLCEKYACQNQKYDALQQAHKEQSQKYEDLQEKYAGQDQIYKDLEQAYEDLMKCNNKETRKCCFLKPCDIDCTCKDIHADQVNNTTLPYYLMMLKKLTNNNKTRKVQYLKTGGTETGWRGSTNMVTLGNVFEWLQEVNPNLNLEEAKELYSPILSAD